MVKLMNLDPIFEKIYVNKTFVSKKLTTKHIDKFCITYIGVIDTIKKQLVWILKRLRNVSKCKVIDLLIDLSMILLNEKALSKNSFHLAILSANKLNHSKIFLLFHRFNLTET